MSDLMGRKRKSLALVLIGLGLILIIFGLVFYMKERGSDLDPVDDTRSLDQPLEAVTDEDPDVTPQEDATEDSGDASSENTSPEDNQQPEDRVQEPEVLSPLVFQGTYDDLVGSTYNMTDITMVTEVAPGFHTITSIVQASGTNPATEMASDNLTVILSAVPDRHFSIAVLVETDQTSVQGGVPDAIQGLQWTLSYTDSGFQKSERLVSDDAITFLAAENFNIRFEGKETFAQVDFFGPVGTHYYAILIYDDTFCTVILPE